MTEEEQASVEKFVLAMKLHFNPNEWEIVKSLVIQEMMKDQQKKFNAE